MRSAQKFIIDLGKTVRCRPLVNRFARSATEKVTRLTRGGSNPRARNASITTMPLVVLAGGRIQCSSTSSARSIFRRRPHGLCASAATSVSSLNRTSTSRSSPNRCRDGDPVIRTIATSRTPVADLRQIKRRCYDLGHMEDDGLDIVLHVTEVVAPTLDLPQIPRPESPTWR